eukprot:PhF_6_TR44210/c0_g1_i1/m.67896
MLFLTIFVLCFVSRGIGASVCDSTPAPYDFDLFSCAVASGANDTILSARIQARVCVCRGGTVTQYEDAIRLCSNDKRTCASLSCHIRRRIAEVELYGPYASGTSSVCTSFQSQLRQMANGKAKEGCVTAACNHTETISCTDNEINTVCKDTSNVYSYWSYSSQLEAYRNLPTIPVRVTRDVSENTFRIIKEGLGKIFAVSDDDVLFLLPNDGYAVISVLDSQSPLTSRQQVLSTLQKNQNWIDKYLRPERPSWCPAPTPKPSTAACSGGQPTAYNSYLSEVGDCNEQYCGCLGYTEGVRNCSVPVGSTSDIFVSCMKAKMKCLFSDAYRHLNNKDCGSLHDYVISPSTIEADCISHSCKMDDATIFSQDTLTQSCQQVKEYSTTLSVTNDICTNETLPPAYRVDFGGCGVNIDLDDFARRNDYCDMVVCGCRGGIALTSTSGDVTCSKPTRDCGTMNCTELRYVCYLDLMSKYATYTSIPQCVTLAKDMGTVDQFDCYAISCSYLETSTCRFEEYVEKCDMFPTLGKQIKKAQLQNKEVPTVKTSLVLTSISIDRFAELKKTISTILGISQTTFALFTIDSSTFAILFSDMAYPLINEPRQIERTIITHPSYSAFLQNQNPMCSNISVADPPPCSDANTLVVVKQQKDLCDNAFCSCVGQPGDSWCNIPGGRCGQNTTSCEIKRLACYQKNVYPAYQSANCVSTYSFWMNTDTQLDYCNKRMCEQGSSCSMDEMYDTCQSVIQTMPTNAPTASVNPFCGAIPQEAFPDSSEVCNERGINVGIVDSVRVGCDSAYCNCLGVPSDNARCSYPQKQCGNTKCMSDYVDCLYDKLYPLYNVSRICYESYTFRRNPQHQRVKCLTSACTTDTLQNCGQEAVTKICDAAKTFSEYKIKGQPIPSEVPVDANPDVCLNVSVAEYPEEPGCKHRSDIVDTISTYKDTYCACVSNVSSPTCDVDSSVCGWAHATCVVSWMKAARETMFDRNTASCSKTLAYFNNDTNIFNICMKDMCSNKNNFKICNYDDIVASCRAAADYVKLQLNPKAPIVSSYCLASGAQQTTNLRTDTLKDCARTQDSQLRALDRYNLCVERRCTCAGGNVIKSFQGESNCSVSVTTCSKAKCKSDYKMCLMEVFLPYSNSTRGECTLMRRNFLQYDDLECTSDICWSRKIGEECSQTDILSACSSSNTYNSALQRYLNTNDKTGIYFVKTSMYTTSLDALSFLGMKEDIAGILNTDSTSVGIIFAQNFEFGVIVLPDALPTDFSSPVLSTTEQIEKALTSNQAFLDKYGTDRSWVKPTLAPWATPAPPPTFPPLGPTHPFTVPPYVPYTDPASAGKQENNDDKGKEKLTGAVAGVLVGLGLIGGVIAFLVWYRKKKRSNLTPVSVVYTTPTPRTVHDREMSATGLLSANSKQMAEAHDLGPLENSADDFH